MKKLLSILAFAICVNGTAQTTTAVKTQCKGITTAGKQCSRKVAANAVYCYQHINSHNNTAATTTAAVKTQCTAITKKGSRCSRTATAGKTTCFQHSKTI